MYRRTFEQVGAGKSLVQLSLAACKHLEGACNMTCPAMTEFSTTNDNSNPSDSRGPIFFDSRDPVVIFSDSRDPIFNSMDLNRVPKTPFKKPAV